MAEHNDSPHPTAIRTMFAGVARRYDLLNHLLSGGLDRRWRRRAADAVACSSRDRKVAGTYEGRCDACAPIEHPPPLPRRARTAPRLVIDVCTGTGDLAMTVLRQWPRCRVVACDFCRPMVARAREKVCRAGLGPRAAVVEADALALPLADAVADAACCAFGVRNLADEAAGLSEMVRVVRPGGRVVALEFHRPRGRGPLAALFGLYFRRILPRLGGWISGGRHGGYAYLVRSIEAFGPPERLARAMQQAGLRDVTVEPLPGGIASLYVGTRG
ncbi:MAG: class I SAM-dependent methyltransferase [Planctomycetes bacterium]|nr:class I SAM-dependent methyltransferase [Planctomycetota bacterium]